MKKIIVTLVFMISTSLFSQTDSPIAIVIHGGAGTILKKNLSPEKEKEYREKLKEAIETGYAVLKKGGSSLEAVQQTIMIMEDSPLFNSGKGAVLTAEGTASLDASIMTGNNLNAGAIAGAEHIKNPIKAATLVMQKSPFVMLSGKGADKFAKLHEQEMVDNNYFITERRKKDLERIQQKERAQAINLDKEILEHHKRGTVGCVAIDKTGTITAGTSTGGTTNKKWGRIGDSPIIGAGTYADNESCGVSATGWGEFFIRANVAYNIVALFKYKNYSIDKAAEETLATVKELGGDGGVIVLDKEANISMNFNTEGMYRASIDKKGKLEIKIYKNETN